MTLFSTAPAVPPPLTVAQLNGLVRQTLKAALPEALHVQGEVSNVSRPSSGHVYFTLKDAESEVRCVMWRNDAVALRFQPADGLSVVVTATLDVYEPRGQYQLYVRRIEPVGVGALELAFRQLREKLAREGLFDPARKRPLPRLPRRIALVTSPTGAAIRDMLQTLRRRCPTIHVLVYPVRVQGEGAADEIASAIRRLSEQSERLGGIDVMIVGRGGGSLEDLWAFNEEVVARAIHASRIPVVSAVGHEVDFTIADFVADVRAATPTAAAELVAPMLSELLDRVDSWRGRMSRAVRAAAELARSRLRTSERSEWFRDPLGCLRRHRQGLDEATGRLRLALSRRAAAARADLQKREIALHAVRPEAVLARRREHLGRIENRLNRAQHLAALAAERRLAATTARLQARTPLRAVERNRLRVEHAAQRVRRGTIEAARRATQRLREYAARLEAGGHERVLRRGFSITRRQRGRRLVTGPRDVRLDERIITQTADGLIHSKVVDGRQGELFA